MNTDDMRRSGFIPLCPGRPDPETRTCPECGGFFPLNSPPAEGTGP